MLFGAFKIHLYKLVDKMYLSEKNIKYNLQQLKSYSSKNVKICAFYLKLVGNKL
jgi:hypothetical protein